MGGDGSVRQANPTRRAFLIGGAALVAGAALGMCVQPSVAQANVLRPPGALPEAEFMARCIKCERCISVCPTDVLRPLGIEAGLAQARTPVVSFASNLCTFCDECRAVCPTAAIGPADPWNPAAGRIGVARVHEDRCIAYLQTQACGVCVDACPYGALSFDAERRPVVDEAACNGCGECVRICPANVLRSFGGGAVRGIEVVTEKTYREMAGA